MVVTATNLSMIRGDTMVMSMTIVNDGIPQDITGGTFWFTAKNRLSDEDTAAVFEKTNGDGITLTDPTHGVARIELVPADTEDMVISDSRGVNLYWDIQYKNVGGKVYTVARGLLTVYADVKNEIV